jgi:hypothetical protein
MCQIQNVSSLIRTENQLQKRLHYLNGVKWTIMEITVTYNLQTTLYYYYYGSIDKTANGMSLLIFVT